MSDTTSNLLGAMSVIASKQITSSATDLTVVGTVTKLQNATTGEYKVYYEGATFSAFVLSVTASYSVGDQVYVLIPGGDYSATKLIVSNADFSANTSYAEVQAESNQWRTRGANWLSGSVYWRDEYGAERTDSPEGGIVATTMGDETDISTDDGAYWRNYIFNRAELPEFTEQTFTDLRRSKSYNANPAAASTNLLAMQEVADGITNTYGTDLENIMITAKFETLFINTHTTGEYGIIAEVYVDNPNYNNENNDGEPQYNIQQLCMSFSDFNGAPYSFSVPAYQEAVFTVGKGVVKGLARVYLYQTDAWVTDLDGDWGYYDANGDWVSDSTGETFAYVIPVTKRNNIIATDVSIYWCEPVDLSTNWFSMGIYPTGTVLYSGDGEQSSVTKVNMQPYLKYGANYITSEEVCKFTWYRKKYNCLTSAAANFEVDEYGNTWAGYLPEGEQGWCPVAEMMKQAGSLQEMMEDPDTYSIFGESADYKLGVMIDGVFTEVTDSSVYRDTLQVPVSEVPWQWEYLCVCYYNPSSDSLDSVSRTNWNDALIWTTETVSNLNSLHSFELPEPYILGGGSTAVLRVRNNFLSWLSDEPYNPDNYYEPDPIRDYYCRWWISSGSTYVAMQDSTYDRFIKGIRPINQYLNNEVLTFRAQVYGRHQTDTACTELDTNAEKIAYIASIWDDDESEPDMDKEYDEYEIANLEIVIAPTDSPDIIASFAGQTHHNYNSSGILNNSSAVGDQYDITPTLTVTNSALMNFSVEWIAPDGTPLGSRTDEEITAGTGYNMVGVNTMLKDMWASYPTGDNNQCVLHYKVEEAYYIDDVEAEGNTFILRITYLDGTYLDIDLTITYSMAGYNGTQGSEWTVNIWPCNTSLGSGNLGYTAFTKAIANHPVPLMVYDVAEGVTPSGVDSDGNPIYDSIANLVDPNFQLYLRPFIRKNGVNIEDLTETTNYSYKVYWDSRLTAVNNSTSARAEASYGNFLKFQHVCARDADDYGSDGVYDDDGSTLYGGTSYTAGTTLPAGVVDSQAFTCSSDERVSDTDGTTEDTHGAIRVMWNERRSIFGSDYDGSEVTYEQIGHSFVIKARIEIFYQGTGVASVTSFYPVDIIFTNDTTNSDIDSNYPQINPNNIKTNWPTEVLYTSTGTSPTTSSAALYLLYGEEVDSQNLDNVYNVYPKNLTPAIQDITQFDSGYDMTGAYDENVTYTRTIDVCDICYYDQYFFRVRNIGDSITGVTPDVYSSNDESHPWVKIADQDNWYLYPRDYYFFEEYDNGAIVTDLTENTGKWPITYDDDGDPIEPFNPDFVDWNGASFVRTVVYYLNQYGNDSINGWDGKSIDINEEDGTIFSPTIGAGWKHPFTNTFSGVIMGIDTSQLKENYTADYGGFSQDDIYMNPYMTGLFGYQDGYCSFGIMENGTAFFGRADTGGRITIDGFNAQIYGGTTMDGETGLNADMRNKMRLSFIDFGGADREMTYDEWINEQSYMDQVSYYQNWLEVYEVYYYYVTGKYLPSIKQPEDGDDTTYKMELDISDNETITIRIKTGEAPPDWDKYGVTPQYTVDWDEYKLDRRYRLTVDTVVSYFIKDMNRLNVGCTIGPIVNGKPGIAMEGFVVDGYVDPVTGRQVDVNAENTEEGTYINSNFAEFFAPGIGILPESGIPDPDTKFMGVDYVAAQYAGYFTSNSFSTPAIEIGSYADWMVDPETGERIKETRDGTNGTVNWLSAKYGSDYDPDKTYYHTGSDLIRSYTTAQIQDLSTATTELEIPGYRKFLVTYDGTLYAMNAFIKGNIIGSNIIASQFFNNDGSYVVFENGDLGIGPKDGATSSSGWSETKIKEDYSKKWSSEVPESEEVTADNYLTDPESYDNYLNVDGSNTSQPFAFFVSNDGEVICEKIHIAGGSINIGNFHVLGSDTADDNREGDVVSFGTMFLVGTPDGMPGIGNTAVEAWGDFNLRGRLVNLGPVFLGGKLEKNQPGENWERTYESDHEYPTSMNSPIAIVPATLGDTELSVNSDPNLPVEIGIWPLYFHVAEQTQGDTGAYDNANWVCLSGPSSTNTSSDKSISNNFMPAFSGRPDQAFLITDLAEENLGANVIWRVDQLGMWTDGMMFTKRAWNSSLDDDKPFCFEDDGLGYLGWWKQTDGLMTAESLTLQNYSYNAPGIVIETPGTYRFGSRGDLVSTRGKTADGAVDPIDSTIIIETAEYYKYHADLSAVSPTASLVLQSRAAGRGGSAGGVSTKPGDSTSNGTSGSPEDLAGITAGAIYLGGVRNLMTAADYAAREVTVERDDTVQAVTGVSSANSVTDSFISIDRLLASDWQEIQDEFKRTAMKVPPYYPGQIWIKSKGVTIDGSDSGCNSDTYYSISNPARHYSSIRLNRGPWGGTDETNQAGADATVLSLGMSSRASLSLSANDIEIVAKLKAEDQSRDYGNGNIHIRTNGWKQGDENDGLSSNEIFLDCGGHANFKTDYVNSPTTDVQDTRGGIYVAGREIVSIATKQFKFHAVPDGTVNQIVMNNTTDSIQVGVDGTTTGLTKYIRLIGSAGSDPSIELSYTTGYTLKMTATEYRLSGYTAEQQYGIYARFA